MLSGLFAPWVVKRDNQERKKKQREKKRHIKMT
jgi:hypothetical protein